MTVKSISPKELYALMQKETVQLIDVRSTSEFKAIHIEGAKCQTPEEISTNTHSPTYIMCASGARSSKACQKLLKQNAIQVTGGIQAWEAAELPVIKGSGPISIQRQVFITAGSFIFVGALLALLSTPIFALIPLFFGGGLLFAGISDTCMLGQILLKMPWNR